MIKQFFTAFVLLLFIATPSYAEHFFGVEDNTWYREIPSSPTLISTSANVISFMNSYYTNILGYNYTLPDDDGVPIWYAAIDDPLVSTFQEYCHPTVKDAQCNAIPLPAAARSAGNDVRCVGVVYRDSHMVIINYEQTYAWDFYQVAYCEDNSEPGGDDDNICESGETCEWRFGGSGMVRRWDF